MTNWKSRLATNTLKSNMLGNDTKLTGSTAAYTAEWTQAESGRARFFLSEAEWELPAYFVMLPPSIYTDPALQNGCELVRVSDGLSGVVRHLDPTFSNNTGHTITLLVVIVGR